eukprot:1840253-Amphidinium_carterae.1
MSVFQVRCRNVFFWRQVRIWPRTCETSEVTAAYWATVAFIGSTMETSACTAALAPATPARELEEAPPS